MNRQKRVQRLKRIIILTVITAILIPTVLCIYLIIRMNHLEQRMEQLYQTRIEYLQGEARKAAAKTQKISENAVLEEVIPEEVTALDGSQEDTQVSKNQTDARYKVYLTFDDGPSMMTDDILDILAEYQVKATFFVVGKKNPELLPMYQRIVEEGHTIGMHSYSHRYQDIYDSMDSFEADLDAIQELIYNRTGVWSKYYRFPGGSSNDVSNGDMLEYIQCLHDRDIEYFDWNVFSGDITSGTLTKEEIVENVMGSFGKYHTSVVLMHDSGNRKTTVEALPEIIEEYQKRGAVLLPIDDDTTLVQHIQIDE